MSVTESSSPVATVRFLLQKRQPNGDLKFLESAETFEEILDLRRWWLEDAADPEEYAKKLRIVKEVVVTTFSEISV